MVTAHKVINTFEYIYVRQRQTSWLYVKRYWCLHYNNVYIVSICVFGECFITSFIVPKKIYYVEKTTSYLLFPTISNKRIVVIIMFTVIFKQTHSWSLCWPSSCHELKKRKQQPLINKQKQSPYTQGNGTLLGQKHLMYMHCLRKRKT